MTRRPSPASRRPHARLTGLAALLALIAVIAGVPVLLLAIGAGPIPSHLSLTGIRNTLTSRDDGTGLMLLLRFLAWAAWAFVTVSVLLEIGARARGLRPPHLPGLALPQSAARGLVGAAALFFVAAPLAAQAAPAQAATMRTTAPPASITAETSSSIAAAAAATPAQHVTTSSETASASTRNAHPQEPPDTQIHTVKSGETLWKLAARYLGDGTRFQEIADLNYHRPQPDGRRLSNDHWLHPGWQLVIPAGPKTPDVGDGSAITVHNGDTLWGIADDHLGDGNLYPEIFKASQNAPQPDGSHLTDPDDIHAGQVLHLPGRDDDQHPARQQDGDPNPAPTEDPATGPQPLSPHVATPSPAATTASGNTQTPPPAATVPAATLPAATAPAATLPAATVPAASPDRSNLSGQDSIDLPVRTIAGVGAVLAAGVLTLVGSRRRRQQRRRQPGHRIVMPEAEAAATELELRATADPISVTTVDHALRALAAHHAQTQTPLPVVRAARLTDTQLELYLAEPSDLPGPWERSNDPTVWILPAAATSTLVSRDLSNTPAPYPALVTVGHDLEDGHIFLDLEYLGALAITGDETRTQQTATALAIELATSRWADDLQITIVGAHPELEDILQSGRIRYLPSAGRVLDDLDRRAATDRQALSAAHANDLQHARITGTAPDAWTPEIVIFAGPLTARQRLQLSHLVHTDTRPRVAIAAITCDLTIGEWVLDLASDDDLATLTPTGLQLRPQRIDPTTYQHVLEVLALTDIDDTPEAGQVEPEPNLDTLAHISPTPDPTPTAAAPPALDVVDPVAPVVLVLGPVDLVGAEGSVEPPRRARLLEYAAYLALNPGVSHTQIDAAIWPGRRSEDNLNNRNTSTSKLRSWLGYSPGGEHWLPRHQPGGYALDPRVRSDWSTWTQLLPAGPVKAPTEALEQALGLVRGRPFEGVHPRRYAWAEPIAQRMISEIVDASYELARRRLMEGRWRAAEAAVVTGLAIDPGLERLWRLRILAAHETRDVAAEREAIERMLVITDQLGGDLEPRTQALLDAIENGQTLDHMMGDAL